MSRFKLSKWYLDAVTDAGIASIFYHAHLELGPIRFNYASCLEGRTETSTDAAAPQLDDACLRYNGLAWTPLAPPIRATLAEGIEWHCVMPLARVAGGLGYVEHLNLTVPPWQLPFRTLKWGRFCGPGASLVWIEWDGSRRWMWRDSQAVEEAPLELGATTVLRQGPLANIRGLRAILPASLARVEETKWLSRARLGPVEGWAIHESVEWG